jgi:serine/threonine-protein kinase
MSLAKAGQVLMTRAVFDSARQVLKGEDIPGVGPLEWLNHGPYLLKGLDEPLEICEVREKGTAASPPTSSEKAARQVRTDDEPVLGWRPALGQAVPNTRWVLQRKLGEGGFGEVWLARNSTTREHRVFKFCFQAERVRFLKRELTLFRVLKERMGDHPSLVAIRDVNLDHPPFYVEMEYVDGADLRAWCDGHGAVLSIPLETRLEIAAQAAEGLQAAHAAGIVHRDIKPANILISGKNTKEVRAKVSDFGIGQVVSEEYLKGITRAGFTQTILADSSSSRTGTQLYMAPELLAGKPATAASDIYSLGVVLYQLLVGDFTRPLTTDWARHIEDRLLREDLERCFAGAPEERFASAEALSGNLRTLPQRRLAVQRQEEELAARERAAYRRGVWRAAAVAAVLLALISGLGLVAIEQSFRAKSALAAEKRERARTAQAAEAEKTQRERAQTKERDAQRLLYAANMNVLQQAWQQTNSGRVAQLLTETATNDERGFEWFYWQRETHRELLTFRGHLGSVWSVAFSPSGDRIVTGSLDGTAKVWDTATGHEVITLEGHRNWVPPLPFPPRAIGL